MWARRQYDLWNSEAEKKSSEKSEKQEKKKHMGNGENVDKDDYKLPNNQEIETDKSNPTNE